MIKCLLLSLLLSTLFSSSVISQSAPPIEAGVSQTLAKWRAANYSDVRYNLNLKLEKGASLMKGEIEVSVKLTATSAQSDLILDWRTTQFANDKDQPFANVVQINDATDIISTVSNEHLIVPKGALKTGENIIKINFASPIRTSGAATTRYIDKEDGAEYVYSLFVPSDASTAFPVFDQPDLKARFQLNIVAPEGWKVVSNGEGQEFVHEGDKGKRVRYYFIETKPISTYVFAFAAGDFIEVYEPRTRFPTLVYVRKSQAEKFKPHAAETFRLNREAVKYLAEYFDYKFPFPKYDLVLIPEFPFGGMEHAGVTFLREDRVIFPTEPTKNDFVTRANLIFHEAAHQWFGDTVTMRWFDDLWLKEGFAEFMAYKTLERVMPEYNAWKIFYERNKQAAYLTDSTKGTTPIYQEIPNLASAKSAYGNIVYRKAPSFLKQAEFYLGADKFQTAVRAFLKKHQFANAEWTDLVKEFETASGQDLKDWANVWVTKRGLPKFRLRVPAELYYSCSQQISLFQLDNVGENNSWKLRIKVLIKFTPVEENKNTIKEFDIKELETIIYPYDRCKASPQYAFIFPNYQDYGYGIFLLDSQSRAYVLANIQNEPDDFLRTMMWGSLWDSVREAELAPADYVRLVIKNIAVEPDESTIQTLLGRVSTAMNYYLSDKQRDELAPKLEAVLLGKMRDAKTLGQRITFYRAYLNNASNEFSQEMLKKFLKNGGKTIQLEMSGEVVGQMPTMEVPPLKTKDKFDIVTKLLILEDKRIIGNSEAEKLLAELEKTETSDEAKRYAYAARAGIATADNKQKYFNDFTVNKELSESYIESAFAPFNSPKHADLTISYLEKALAELPNLKKNRKIFFVGGWLGAFIGGQKSEQALAIVNKFLADNPNLDRDLRLKILENADNLERAVKIRQKYEK